MASVNYSLCKVARKCKYGSVVSESLVTCDYLQMTGKIRSRQPGGEIVDGKCGLFTEKRKSNE